MEQVLRTSEHEMPTNDCRPVIASADVARVGRAGPKRTRTERFCGSRWRAGERWRNYAVEVTERLHLALAPGEKVMVGDDPGFWTWDPVAREIWQVTHVRISHPDVFGVLEWRRYPQPSVAITRLLGDPNPGRSAELLAAAMPLLNDFRPTPGRAGRPRLTEEEVGVRLDQALARLPAGVTRPTIAQLAEAYESPLLHKDTVGLSVEQLRSHMRRFPGPFRQRVPHLLR